MMNMGGTIARSVGVGLLFDFYTAKRARDVGEGLVKSGIRQLESTEVEKISGITDVVSGLHLIDNTSRHGAITERSYDKAKQFVLEFVLSKPSNAEGMNVVEHDCDMLELLLRRTQNEKLDARINNFYNCTDWREEFLEPCGLKRE